MIHSGAIVAAGVSQGRSRVLKRDFKVSTTLKYLKFKPSAFIPLKHFKLRCSKRGVVLMNISLTLQFLFFVLSFKCIVIQRMRRHHVTLLPILWKHIINIS